MRRQVPARDVVEHHREFGCVGDRREVTEEAFLRRLRVVRRDRHDTVDAGIGGALRQLNRLAGVVGSGPGDHRHPVADGVDRGLEEGDLLDLGKGRRLARWSHPRRCRPSRDRRGSGSTSRTFRSRSIRRSPNGVMTAVRTWPNGASGLLSMATTVAGGPPVILPL